MHDFDVYGIFIPSFLIQAILAYLLFVCIEKWIDILNKKGWLLAIGLFKLCMYILCLWVVHQIFLWLMN